MGIKLVWIGAECVQKALKRLRDEQANGDIEMAHANADEELTKLLISLGLQEVVEEYKKVPKWYA